MTLHRTFRSARSWPGTHPGQLLHLARLGRRWAEELDKACLEATGRTWPTISCRRRRRSWLA